MTITKKKQGCGWSEIRFFFVNLKQIAAVSHYGAHVSDQRAQFKRQPSVLWWNTTTVVCILLLYCIVLCFVLSVVDPFHSTSRHIWSCLLLKGSVGVLRSAQKAVLRQKKKENNIQ